MASIKSLLLEAAQQLAAMSETPRLDADCLLSFVLSCSRTYLMTYPEQPVMPAQQHVFSSLLERRLQGEPVAYLVGQQEFYGLTLSVSPAVLIPRPATEALVDWILQQRSLTATRVLELATGSGAIAIALAHARPSWQVVATDISQAALAVAQANAERHQLASISFIESDWFASIPSQRFDLVVANPPYIADSDPHLLSLGHEPRTALVAEDHGLADIRQILQQARAYLADDGVLLIEHGFDQGEQVVQMAKELGWQSPQCCRDLAGMPRFLLAFAG